MAVFAAVDVPHRASPSLPELIHPGLLAAVLGAAAVTVLLFSGFLLWSMPSGPITISGAGHSISDAVHLDGSQYTLTWADPGCSARQRLTVELVPGQVQTDAAARTAAAQVLAARASQPAGTVQFLVPAAGYYKFLVWGCGSWRLSLAKT